MRKIEGRHLGRWVSTAIGLVAVVIAVLLLLGDEAALDALLSIEGAMVGLVMAFQGINVVTDSIRYRMVVPSRFRSRIPQWRWHRIFAVGRLLNLVFPQAGTVYRAAQLRISDDMPVSAFMGGVAVITWLGNGLALVITAVVLAAVGELLAAVVVLAVAAVILVLVVVVPRMGIGAPGGLRRRIPAPAAAAAAGFGESFVELARTPGRLARVLAVSATTQLSGVAAFVVVCVALGVPDPLVAGAILYASTTIVTVVSLTPGGLGITELAAAAAGTALDLGAGVGVLVALVIRVTGILAVTLLAAAAMIAEQGSPEIIPPSDGSR